MINFIHTIYIYIYIYMNYIYIYTKMYIRYLINSKTDENFNTNLIYYCEYNSEDITNRIKKSNKNLKLKKILNVIPDKFLFIIDDNLEEYRICLNDKNLNKTISEIIDIIKVNF